MHNLRYLSSFNL